MIRYNTKRFWGYSADTKPAYAQIGDRFLELDTRSEYFLSTFNKWELMGQTFTGGPDNCINQLYLNEIYPCTSNINIQPLSNGKVFFGSLSGASGFTVDLVSSTDATPSKVSTRLGLNTNSPSYTFDFYGRDRKNRLYFRDDLTGSVADIKNIIFSGDSDTNSSYYVLGPDVFGSPGAHGIGIGIRGYTTVSSANNDGVGKTGDSFITAFANTNGINIINGPGGGTEDYIRFYAGQLVNNNTPDIHIQGSGSTKGFVGIKVTGVTNQLHVSATTNPLRLEGLQQSGLTRYLVVDNSGVVYYTTGTTTGGTSVIGDYLPLSGGTVTGATIFQSGLTANTIYTNYIDFNTSSTPINNEGRLIWNNADEIGGLEVTMMSGNTILQIGEENLARVYNADSVTLTAGTVVYVFGSQGNTISVKRASNSGETTSSRVLGIVSESIISGERGFVNTFGLVKGLNTLAYTGGTPIWLGTTPGSWTSTEPDAPNHTVLIGFISRSANSPNGSLFVHISNGWELNELHNVYAPNPSDGDVLKYSAATSVWVNSNTLNLSGLTATTISATTYQGLPYSGNSNYVVKWSGSTGLTDSLIYDNGSIVVVSGTTATVSGSKFSVTGPIAAQGVQLSSKNGSIALATSNYSSWGTGENQIAIGDGGPLGSSTGTNNIAIGSASMKTAVTPSGNTAIGTETLNQLNTGNYNVAIGYNAAINLDQTDEAVYIGYQSGLNGGPSTYNVVIGSQAAMSLSGVNNVAIGRLAFGDKTLGNGNVAIGTGAGRASTGGGNVFLGFQAGYYSTGDNKLFIHNSAFNPPLIYGEFDNLRLGVGTTAVTNTLHVSATTHPLRLEGLVSSANTRYLVANSDGIITYVTGSTGSSSGFTTIAITGTNQFDSSSSQVLNFSGINMTITTAATNTLVFSAGTGGGGGVTSITTGSGLSADSTTGAITIVATATTSFGVAVDGSGGVITTGQKGYVRIPYDFTITSWTLIGSPSGSITFDIWKRAGAIPTVANTIITGGTKPSLSTATFATSSTLTGWNITGATGDVVGWNVDICTTTSFATLQLFVTRTS